MSNQYISISIDLVGSTQAKTNILEAARGEFKRIDALNGQIYEMFVRLEARFFQLCVFENDKLSGLDVERFFVVKGIGDEIWILCEIKDVPGDLDFVSSKIISAASVIVQKDITFLATQYEDGPHFEADFDYGSVKPVNSPIKIFIDLVDHATEISELRHESLWHEIPALIGGPHGKNIDPVKWRNVANRLNLGFIEENAEAPVHFRRTDYIGHEIDRFFRATKAAKSGVVSIGHALIDQMNIKWEPLLADISRVTHTYPAAKPPISDTKSNWVYVGSEILGGLKGIGYDYSVYNIFDPGFLLGCYAKMDRMEEQDMPFSSYAETRNFLPDSLLKWIRDAGKG